MNDYDRFLREARSHLEHVDRLAAWLLSEGKIEQAKHDALTAVSRHLLHAAYQAGRCEPAGVTDLDAELIRVQ